MISSYLNIPITNVCRVAIGTSVEKVNAKEDRPVNPAPEVSLRHWISSLEKIVAKIIFYEIATEYLPFEFLEETFELANSVLMVFRWNDKAGEQEVRVLQNLLRRKNELGDGNNRIRFGLDSLG